MHAEVFVSQVSGAPIRVACRCGRRKDHPPLTALLRRNEDRLADTMHGRAHRAGAPASGSP
ncbi:hypothetical protein LLS1_23980 [Leifsonia sp. LS1]|nr:hypothetical protein LLS1_23980 [Leifsonia sp. LS1]